MRLAILSLALALLLTGAANDGGPSPWPAGSDVAARPQRALGEPAASGPDSGCDGGESHFPEAEAFLGTKGYPSPAYTVLLTWNERSRGLERELISGYRVRPSGGGEAFDLYADPDGTLLDAGRLEALGIRPKNWDVQPIEKEAELPPALAKAALPRPKPKGPALGLKAHEQVDLPPIDLQAVLDEDWVNENIFEKGATRTGVFQDFDEPVRVTGNEASHGQWQSLGDGGRLWSLAIYSPEAFAQRVHFEELALPAGAQVVVYNAADPDEAYGPYATPVPGETGLWSATCFADTVVVECYVPAGVAADSLRLSIERTVHVYVRFGDLAWAKAAGSCNLDVTCYAAWSTTARGIGGIGTIGYAGSLWCTGTLLADTDSTTTIPYFLTANHCVANQTEASTIEVYWLYQTATCNGAAPSPSSVPRTIGGADYLAGQAYNPGNDFTLLRLRNDPPTGLTYVGWSTSLATVGADITCIHHPKGDYKRVSFGDVLAVSSVLVAVTWTDGVTEPGSSGSPLMFTSDQKVIGQLLGGDSSCLNPTGTDYYGRFDKTYPIVETYLDPVPALPEVRFGQATYSANENAGTATITVLLDKAPGAGNTATVHYATADGTALAGEDYTSSSGTVTFGATDITQTFTVPLTNDDVHEDAETATLSLSSPTGCTLATTYAPATLSIVDDDALPAVNFSQTAFSVTEGLGSATIMAVLDKAPGAGNSARVHYATADGTALDGQDYTAASGTLTFGATETSQIFSVPILNDEFHEATETVSLSLSSPGGCTLAATYAPASLNIVDNDALPTVDFSTATFSTDEGAGSVTITVALSKALGPGNSATVNYATSNGAATAGSDYVATSGTLTFGATDTLQSFAVQISDDGVRENPETVGLTLSGASGCQLGTSNNPATLTILDNENAPTVDFGLAAYGVNESAGSATISVSLSAAPGGGYTATVHYATEDDTAIAGSDYVATSGDLTFGATDIEKTFTVSITNDAVHENSERLILRLSSASECVLGVENNPAPLVILDDDALPAVNFSQTTFSATESAGTATITVSLDKAPGTGNSATVNYATANGTALAGQDYTAASGTLTFGATDTSKTFAVTVTNDTVHENTETVTLSLSSPSGCTLAGTYAPATLSIVDDDALPAVNFSQTTFSATESAGTATITVSLDKAPGTGNSATVNYATANGTAQAGQDYTAASGTLTFGATDTTKTFAVTVTNDTVHENTETVTLSLSSPSGCTLAGTYAPATLSIVDDDALPAVNFSQTTFSATESAGTATITVSLDKAPGTGNSATVNYATANGTAQAGQDYTAASGTLTFGATDTTKTFAVTVTNDTVHENTETVTLSLSSPSGCTLATSYAPATLNIVDDDPAPTVNFSQATFSANEGAGLATITVALNKAPGTGSWASVAWATSDGTAQAGQDYTAASGTLTFGATDVIRTFSVPILNDAVHEDVETITLSLSDPVGCTPAGAYAPATLSIVDDDPLPVVNFSHAAFSVNEGAGSATITVTLDKSPGAGNSATVDYATADGTARAGEDYTAAAGTLTFGATDTTKTFPAPITDDAVSEDTETVTLSLSNPSGGTLAATYAPSTLNIIDNEGPLTVNFSQVTFSVNESAGNATITVTLNRAPGTGNSATVNYATADGTAHAGEDYTAAAGTLTFGATDVTRSFTAPIVDDTVHENSETVTLSLSDPVGCTLATTYAPATLSIVDDDALPTVNFSQATFSTDENAGTATITVSLNKAPGTGNSATVNYATADGTAYAGEDYTAAAGTLTFGATDVTRTFTVSITNDAVHEDTETVFLSLSTPVGCTSAATYVPAVSSILDDDGVPTVGFSDAAFSVNEGAGFVTITVTLDKAPGTGSSATVQYATADDTALAGEDYASATGTLEFGPYDTARTFTAGITDNALHEDAEEFTVTLSEPAGCTLATTNTTATVTIADDDAPRDPADINDDGAVDALDVQLAINAALGATIANADVNGDGVVDALDVQLVINAALGA